MLQFHINKNIHLIKEMESVDISMEKISFIIILINKSQATMTKNVQTICCQWFDMGLNVSIPVLFSSNSCLLTDVLGVSFTNDFSTKSADKGTIIINPTTGFQCSFYDYSVFVFVLYASFLLMRYFLY